MPDKAYMIEISRKSAPNPQSLYRVKFHAATYIMRRYETTEARVQQLLAAADFTPVLDCGEIYLVGFRRNYPEVAIKSAGEGAIWGLQPEVSPMTLEEAEGDAQFYDYLADSQERRELL